MEEQAKKRGRPTDYTRELADEICRRMIEGESLRAICKPDDMPSEGTVRAWATIDRDGFYARYTRACEARMDALAEDLLDIADEKDADPNRARLRVDTRKWLMSKIAPKRFGDRARVEHTGADGGPIKTQDLSRFSDEQLAALEAILGGAQSGASQGGNQAPESA